MRTLFGGHPLGLLAVIAGLAVAYVVLSNTVKPAESDRTASSDLPPAGVVWFGSSFDTDTFEIAGRTDTVGTADTFALVTVLPEPMDAGEINMRVSWNGGVVSNSAINATGSGEIWGFTGGPLYEAGVWRYDFTDIGGNVLATGAVTATE